MLGTIPRLFEAGNLLTAFSTGGLAAVADTVLAAAAVSISAKDIEVVSDVIEVVGTGTVGLTRKLPVDDPASAAAVLNDRRLLAVGSKPV